MFFDWLTVHQDFDSRLPLIGDREFVVRDVHTGEDLHSKCPTVEHLGSFSTTLHIRISGNRLTVSGNPSRIDRIENLFGFTSLDQCVAVYNRILKSYDLPEFTKCTRVFYSQQQGDKVTRCTDGAVFEEIHVTTNRSVGKGAEDDYLKGLSMLPYRNSIPRLHTNGKTCDWVTKAGKGGRLIYPSVYNKAFELELHALPKIKRKFGDDSVEYKYLLEIIDWCKSHGVVRFEQKLKSEFLRRYNLNFYGLFDESEFRNTHEQFLNIDQQLQVEHMSLETITARLIREGICDSTRAANATTLYAIQWMHGHTFDLSKTQVKTHRARLRKIGIDIALACDISKFSLVHVKHSRLVEVKSLPMPDWYKKPFVNHLQIAA